MYITVEVQDMGFTVQWDKGNKLYIILCPELSLVGIGLTPQLECFAVPHCFLSTKSLGFIFDNGIFTGFEMAKP